MSIDGALGTESGRVLASIHVGTTQAITLLAILNTQMAAFKNDVLFLYVVEN